jgi:hypothetical protein
MTTTSASALQSGELKSLSLSTATRQTPMAQALHAHSAAAITRSPIAVVYKTSLLSTNHVSLPLAVESQSHLFIAVAPGGPRKLRSSVLVRVSLLQTGVRTVVGATVQLTGVGAVVGATVLDSCTRVLLLRLLFAGAFSQRVSLRRSLGGGHFDALGCGHFDTLGTAIATCSLRHRASGTMKFAKLVMKPLGKPLPRRALKICSILSLPGWHYMSWTSCMASWSGREG